MNPHHLSLRPCHVSHLFLGLLAHTLIVEGDAAVFDFDGFWREAYEACAEKFDEDQMNDARACADQNNNKNVMMHKLAS